MILATTGGSTAGSTAGTTAGVIIFIIIGVAAYLVPTIVAWLRHVPNKGSVTVINVLFGWSLIGWGIALAMACRTRYVATSPYAPQDRFRPPDPPS